MKILVVDDHALVREGLHQVLKGLDEQVEVLEAANCAGAFELVAQHHDLDLVLLDYQLPDMNGLDALDVFGQEHPELPIVMLSGAVNPLMMRQAMDKGAAGFLTKAGPSKDMLSTLRKVLDGEIHVPHELLLGGELADSGSTTGGEMPRQLTPRQEQVLYLLLDGYSTKDISQKLFLADETAKTHVSAIIRAFGVKTRLQAVLAASRYGYAKSTQSA